MTTAGHFGEVTDKAAHGYFRAYLAIAAELGPRARVCELGVWHGESLRLWQALFPFGEVTGVDLSPVATWPPGTRQVITDVTSPQLPEILGGPFDLIVDDASHRGAATKTAFDNLWPLVAPGGFYVVEDWYVALDPVAYGYSTRDDIREHEYMLDVVASFLRLLDSQESAVDEVRYRHGLAIVHRRGAGNCRNY